MANRKIITRITAREYAWFELSDFADFPYAEYSLRILCDAMIDGYFFFYNVDKRGGILTIAKMIEDHARRNTL